MPTLQQRLGSVSSPISQSAKDWDKRYSEAESLWSLEPNQFVAAELFDLPVGKMVDIAGGEGRNALAFANLGWQVENVEFSAVALEKFEARAATAGLTSKCFSNLSEAQSAKFSFQPSLVLIAYLQIPFAELEKTLDNALSQMPHGTLFGVFHARRNLREGYGGPQSIELLPSVEQLCDWAERRGLDALIEERFREVKTPAGVRQAIDLTLKVTR